MKKNIEKQLTSWLKQQKSSCGFFLQLSVLLGLLNGLAIMLQAYLIASIVHNTIMLEQAAPSQSNLFISLFALIPIRALLTFARERCSFEAGKRLRVQIRKAVLDKLSELGPAYIKGKPAGSWATIVLEQVENLHDFYARYLPQMLLAVFIPLTILVIVFPLNWAAGLILFATAPLIPLFMSLVGKGAADANRKNFQALAQLSGHFMDRLQGLRTIKLFNHGKEELREIEKASDSFRIRTMSVLKLAFLSSAVLEFFAAVSIAVLAVYFGFSYLGELNFGHYGQPITLFTGLFVLMLAPEFYQPLRDMGTHYHAKAQAVGAAQDLKQLLEHPVSPYQQDNTAKQNPDWQQGVSIKALDLEVYSHDGTLLVGPMSFEVKAGQHIALVGASGSGKSSLMNALLGFLPYQGSLLINGIELNQIEMAQWRQQLAWLGQDPQLFYGSIRDNLTLGNQDLDDKQLQGYLEQSHIWQFVNEQKQGLNHAVGEKMGALSVGQAQRIALARALTKQAQCYLLDEPTASLDQHSEQMIFATLKAVCKGVTSLMITHRLEQLQQVDCILVMQQGKLVEQGSFEALNQQDGVFKQLLNAGQQDFLTPEQLDSMHPAKEG